MRIISFSWTWPALVAERKTVTRRPWTPAYARSFHPGLHVAAWDYLPRTRRGEQIGIIEIESVSYEADSETPDTDYAAEGFEYLYHLADQCLHQQAAWPNDAFFPGPATVLQDTDPVIFDGWRKAGGWSWVVRFRPVEIFRLPFDPLVPQKCQINDAGIKRCGDPAVGVYRSAKRGQVLRMCRRHADRLAQPRSGWVLERRLPR